MTRKKRDPGGGLTPLDSTTWTHPETGQPIAAQAEPPRRRRGAPLAAQPVPPPADLAALAEEVERGHVLDRAAVLAAGLRARELRTERNALDAELHEVEHLVRQHRRLFPNDLLPTGLFARFDRARDGIVANERAMAEVRHVLAPGVPEIVVLTPKQPRERTARQAALEAARTQGRKEYAVASHIIASLLAHPTPAVVSDLLTASSGPSPLGGTPTNSVLAMARADVNHPLHGTSQRVTFEDRPSMIFTGR